MPPFSRKLLTSSFESFQDWNSVEYDQVRDAVGMIHCEPKRGVGATIMPDNGKLSMSKRPHQLDACGSLGPFRRAGVVRRILRNIGLTKSRQIWTDNPKGVCQPLRHLPPGDVGPGVAVKQ